MDAGRVSKWQQSRGILSAIPPRIKQEIIAKLGNIHLEILTGGYLKRRLLTKGSKSHIKMGRKGRVAKGASPAPKTGRPPLRRDISAGVVPPER